MWTERACAAPALTAVSSRRKAGTPVCPLPPSNAGAGLRGQGWLRCKVARALTPSHASRPLPLCRHNLFARVLPSFQIMLQGGAEQLGQYAALVSWAAATRLAGLSSCASPASAFGGCPVHALARPSVRLPALPASSPRPPGAAGTADPPGPPLALPYAARWPTATARRCQRGCRPPWLPSSATAGRASRGCAPPLRQWWRAWRKSGTRVGKGGGGAGWAAEEVKALWGHNCKGFKRS